MGKIRILHISDLHISTRKNMDAINGQDRPGGSAFPEKIPPDWGLSSHSPQKLRQVARLAHRLHNSGEPLDAIIATGDIATTGSMENLEFALRFFEDWSGDGFQTQNAYYQATLRWFDRKLIVLPGNHDRYQRDFPWDPGSENFDKVFERHWPPNKPPLIIDNGEDFAVGIVRGDFCLMTTDDVRRPWFTRWGGEWGRRPYAFAQGKATEQLIAQMENETEKTIEKIGNMGKKAVILWAVHFPPKHPAITSFKRLLGERFLLEGAKNQNIQAILCGHEHHHLAYRPLGEKNLPIVFCNGTSAEIGARYHTSCQVIEIDHPPWGEPRIRHLYYHYHETGKYFYLDTGHPNCELKCKI